jgi:hypothetical protein
LVLLDRVALLAGDVSTIASSNPDEPSSGWRHDRVDLVEAGELRGAVGPLAGDQPIPVGVLGHHERLPQPV